MRTTIAEHPFVDMSRMWGERGRWPAKWIAHRAADGTGPIVQAFRRTFTLDQARTIRIHVSADERYELFLDGQRIGRGPERGDRLNWFFETYDLNLSAGSHVLVARSWWINRFGPAPFAQISLRPGFVLAAEHEAPDLLNTGHAAWDVMLLPGYRHVPPGVTWGTGSKLHVIGSAFAWGFETGTGDNWETPVDGDWALGPTQFSDQPTVPILHPATLPPMIEQSVNVGLARHVQALPDIPSGDVVVRAADHLANEANDWNAMLAGRGWVTLPPNTVRRVIVDLQNYYCAYTDLVTTGGRGATIHSKWAESLYAADPENRPITSGHSRPKGNRDEIEGKVFFGVGDVFEPDGGRSRLFNTLWWEAGRYIELTVRTADEPLTIERFSLRETHYPNEWLTRFDSSEPRFADLTPIAQRVMDMCSHETYMDCPYYEQLMYVGDTRLEVLVTYTNTADDRLPRKALRLYDESRKSPGFTQARYPSNIQQTIPPFSAWWVAMVHDFAMWRDDPAFVRTLLPGVRAVMDTFMRSKTSDGLVAGPVGWNFIDWVRGWNAGMPPQGDTNGISGPLNFKLAWVFKQAAELEDHVGDPEMAALQRRRSSELTAAATHHFWSEDRGLFADDGQKEHFSEHTQCLALLGDSVDAKRRPRVIDGLFADPQLAATTVYFSHYLFETAALTGRVEAMFDRLPLWFDMKALGFKTTLEEPEPSRSDCHAWGAHPMYHYYATILGIRPASAGFGSVTIRPQLGPLEWAKGTMTHPKGEINVDVRRSNGKLTGQVKLPIGLNGVLHVNGAKHPIGESTLRF